MGISSSYWARYDARIGTLASAFEPATRSASTMSTPNATAVRSGRSEPNDGNDVATAGRVALFISQLRRCVYGPPCIDNQSNLHHRRRLTRRLRRRADDR